MNFRQQVATALQETVLPPEATLVVGVSGGPDSLALLHALTHVYPREQIVVAHLNHGWRTAAAADEAFVRTTAAAWGVACVVQRVDVARLAAERGESPEEAGRHARYAFFAAAVATAAAAAVATAHNADDQAETVLLHLLRGAGLDGLRGMRPLAHLPNAPEIPLLRPLLHITRAEIEAYCAEHGLRPIHDESNRDITFRRNRVRHELLPLLADYNPQIRQRLRHLAAVAAADVDLLEAMTAQAWRDAVGAEDQGWLWLDRDAWRALPLSLRRRTLRRAVARLRPEQRDLGFPTVEQARAVAETAATGAEATLPGDVVVRVGYGRIWLFTPQAILPVDVPQLADETAVALPIPGAVALAPGWRLRAEVVTAPAIERAAENVDPWRALVDVGEAEALTVRPRQPGERLQPLGMHGRSAKIQDVMVNRRVAARFRQRWPLVATADHPVWLVGLHLDRRARVTEATQRPVLLTVERDDG